MGGACSKHRRKRSAYKILVWKTLMKYILGKRGHGWEDNIKMNFKEISWRLWTDSYNSEYRHVFRGV
jgi:hypothetical protein